MSVLHFPWLEFAIGILVLGAVWVKGIRQPDQARLWTLGFLAISLLATVGAWIDLEWVHSFAAHDRWDLLHSLFGKDLLFVDELSAPLLTLAALIGFLTVLATLRTKIQRLSFSGLLITQAIWQAMLSSEEPWLLIGLVCAGIVPQWLELSRRGKPVRVFLIHMLAHAVLLLVGWYLISNSQVASTPRNIGLVFLVVSILIRCGICPLHCWVTDLFEHATFASALLFVSPMSGAYLAVRLLMPVAPDGCLRFVAMLSLACALYSAGMALIQREPRRYFSYLFLSHASLVLVGLETVTPEALTGGLCVWFAASLSLTGFGLTLRSVESRLGRLSLDDFHGLYEHMPNLAALFLITGLASVGFPGTIGFVSTELLVDGIIHEYPYVGLSVVLASAINGISIMRVYFRIFTGSKHTSSISLQSRWPERVAVMTLVVLMVGGGVFPQPFLETRFDASERIIHDRQQTFPTGTPLNQLEEEVETSSEESDEHQSEDLACRQRRREITSGGEWRLALRRTQWVVCRRPNSCRPCPREPDSDDLPGTSRV